MSRVSLQALALIAITTLVMFTNLGTARLWDRDEPRNAGCALEMMQRGDLIVPIFNDELRFQKPVLVYWLIISAYELFGVNEFAARFWSAVLAVGSVLGTWAIGRRLLDSRSAFFAGILLATSVMFVLAGRAATPDSTLVFCSTLALMFYVLGTFSPRPLPHTGPALRYPGCWFPVPYRYVVAMYAMMGLGVLAKGPVGFVLPCAIIGMFMLLMRLPPPELRGQGRQGRMARLLAAWVRPFRPAHFWQTLWTMRPLTLVTVICLVAGPWYVLVGLETGGSWPRIFLLNENLGRAATTLESHQGGVLYYPLTIIIGFFPASVFLGPMMFNVDRQITRQHVRSPSFVFLVCWVLVQVGLFSLASTKLPSYITPCFPALALLTGSFLSRRIEGRHRSVGWSERWPGLGLLLTGLGLTVALPLLGERFLEGEWSLVWIGLVPLAGGCGMMWLVSRGQVSRANQVFCLTAVVFAIAAFGYGTVLVDRHRTTDPILKRIAEQGARVGVASFDRLESSWVFYGRNPVVELSRESFPGAWQDNREYAWQKREWPSPEQFVKTNPEAMIITTRRHLPDLIVRLPDEFTVIESVDYFLQDGELVLVGPRWMRDGPVRTAHSGDTAPDSRLPVYR